VEIRILGPLDVRIGENQVRVRPGVHRLILTLLALRNGATVGADVLAELIWGDDAPTNPTNALHSQISHLRRSLQPLTEEGGQVLVTVPGGYVLDVPTDAIDAARFEDMVARAGSMVRSADESELREACDVLTEALALWRGEPLADANGHPLVAADVTRLGELRLVALETRNEALLATGRHAELIPALQQLVISHPLHERFHAQLMVALYRAGRQVDALRAAANARRLLAEEVGVDPGVELVVLEQQVLAHAPELLAAAEAARRESDGGDGSGHGSRLQDSSRVSAGVPPVGRHQVVRGRLDSMLEEALDVALVLVAAPAGAGKTAALTGWLNRRTGGGAWVALETADNDPAVFWSKVAGSLGLPRPDAHRDGRAVLGSLLEREASGGTDVLVLDDYHVITNPAVHGEVDALLAAAPGALHVVIGTRHDPPLRLAGLRAARQLHEVRFDDLRLDSAEVDLLFNAVLGLAVSPDDVGTLVDRTEGWAVGVQLAAVSLQHHPDRRAFVDDFAGDDRHIADYLRDEVLSRVADDVRDFLFETAILDRLHASLCDAVTRRSDAHDQLTELERLNLFLLPLDHRRQWYRYHPLFAEWLRLQPVEGVEERHRRAAAWLEVNGFAGDAVRHHIAGRDPASAAALIERERWGLVGHGREWTLHDWIQQLPDVTLRTRPHLTAAAAWVAYAEGRWADVDHFVSLVDPDVESAETDAALLRAELALLTAGRLAALGRLGEAGSLAADALTLVPEHEPRARTGLLLVLGKSRLDGGDLDGAQRALRDAERLADPYGLTIVELIARSHLAEIDRRRNRSEEAAAAARAALEFARSTGLAEHAECAIAHLVLANVYIDAGRLDEAAIEVDRGGALAAAIPYEPRERAAAAAAARLADARTRTATSQFGEQLTPKEHAVLRLLPTSLTPREIADELFVSLNTVKSHTRTLYRKLGVRNRHEAIERARDLKLL
jgi:LuxR family transcriptional regulator, maltose regulon positive regulatory protein